MDFGCINQCTTICWLETTFFVYGDCNYVYLVNPKLMPHVEKRSVYIPLLIMLVLYGRIFVLARRMAQNDSKNKVLYRVDIDDGGGNGETGREGNRGR